MAAPGTQGSFSFSVCCLPVRWRKVLYRWLRNLSLWGFGWLSVALAHFPFSWLDRIKSRPTQIKRTEHLRAHYLMVSKTSPRGLPIEHLISTLSCSQAVRERESEPCTSSGLSLTGWAAPPQESDLIFEQQMSIIANCFTLKGLRVESWIKWPLRKAFLLTVVRSQKSRWVSEFLSLTENLKKK